MEKIADGWRTGFVGVGAVYRWDLAKVVGDWEEYRGVMV